MVKAATLEFVQKMLDLGAPNQEIVYSLHDQFQIDVSVRTLQRWIRDHELQREPPITASDRAETWISDVECLIRRGITLENILYHLRQVYNESISLRTLHYILQVLNLPIVRCIVCLYNFGYRAKVYLLHKKSLSR